MSSQEAEPRRIPVQAGGFLIVGLFIVLFAIVFLVIRWLSSMGGDLGQAWPFLLVFPAAVFGLALAFNVILRLVKGPKVVVIDDEEE